MHKSSLDYLIIGPAHPYRGGISETQHQLAIASQKNGKQVELLTFTKLYPNLLFPGKTQYSNETISNKLKIIKLLHAYNPFYWKKVIKYICSRSPKVVVFRYYTPFLAIAYGWIARGLPKKIKKIALVDNWIPHEEKLFDQSLNQYFGKEMDAFTSLSPFVAKQIKTYCKKPVWSGFHPINENLLPILDQKKIRKKLNWDKSTSYVLFFGLIRKYKGLELLIQAFDQEPLKEQKVKLYVAGECYEDPKKYIKLVELLGLNDRVYLDFNFKNNIDIQHLFSATDIVAQTYHKATQSGVTSIAYHYNRPLLVSDIQELKNPIISDNTGEAVKKEPKAIALGILRLLDKKVKTNYSENMKKVINKYSWTKYAEQWDKFVNENT